MSPRLAWKTFGLSSGLLLLGAAPPPQVNFRVVQCQIEPDGEIRLDLSLENVSKGTLYVRDPSAGAEEWAEQWLYPYWYEDEEGRGGGGGFGFGCSHGPCDELVPLSPGRHFRRRLRVADDELPSGRYTLGTEVDLAPGPSRESLSRHELRGCFQVAKEGQRRTCRALPSAACPSLRSDEHP